MSIYDLRLPIKIDGVFTQSDFGMGPSGPTTTLIDYTIFGHDDMTILNLLRAILDLFNFHAEKVICK